MKSMFTQVNWQSSDANKASYSACSLYPAHSYDYVHSHEGKDITRHKGTITMSDQFLLGTTRVKA